MRSCEQEPIDFEKCALSMTNYEVPCCFEEGVIFEYTSLVKFVEKYNVNPVSGGEVNVTDILRLNMWKNQDGMWHCPITCKVFTNTSHVVAIKKTANVFSYQAVRELNILAKNFADLATGETFSITDIITLQDPTNENHMLLRDVQNFHHLKMLQKQIVASTDERRSMRSTLEIDSNMREIDGRGVLDEKAKLTMNGVSKPSDIEMKDIAKFWSLRPLLKDVVPGNEEIDDSRSMSSTSSTVDVVTRSAVKHATPEDIRDARWTILRGLGKKAYVQLQTTMGTINLELHCDIAPETCYNFIELCSRGYYDHTKFHRLVPDFIVQEGDPNGDGTGGDSIWGRSFKNEFDSRLRHDRRGIVSMANRGPNSNRSQFFVTFKATSHLDDVHTVFGLVVGGMATLDLMENIGCNIENNVPKQEVKILKSVVFQSPLDEADGILLKRIVDGMKSRETLAGSKLHVLKSPSRMSEIRKIGRPSNLSSDRIGKYFSTNGLGPENARLRSKIG